MDCNCNCGAADSYEIERKRALKWKVIKILCGLGAQRIFCSGVLEYKFFLGFYDFVVFNGEVELDEGADEDENQVPAGDEVYPLFCGLEPGGLFEEFAAEKDEEEEKDGYEEEGQSPFIGFVYFCPGGSEFLFFFFGHGFLFLILW